MAFRRGLSEYDLVEGKNVAFEWRRAGPEYERFRELTAELVQRRVSVIFAYGGTAAAVAAKAATSTIPVVFYMSGDPVSSELVISLNRPAEVIE